MILKNINQAGVDSLLRSFADVLRSLVETTVLGMPVIGWIMISIVIFYLIDALAGKSLNKL